MAVVGTAGRGVIIYQLENQPQEFKRMESPLKYQVRFRLSLLLLNGHCKHINKFHKDTLMAAWKLRLIIIREIVSFGNKKVLLTAAANAKRMMILQHRCVSIFVDRKVNPAPPVGFALGSIEGRVAIQYVNPTNPKDNFTFKCHRSNGSATTTAQDIYAVRSFFSS